MLAVYQNAFCFVHFRHLCVAEAVPLTFSRNVVADLTEIPLSLHLRLKSLLVVQCVLQSVVYSFDACTISILLLVWENPV